MQIGAFADNIIEELDIQTIQARDLDRRNIILRADEVRSKLLSNGQYAAMYVNGGWQYKIMRVINELPGQLFISRSTQVLWDNDRKRYYSNMPTPWVQFVNQCGIRMIRPIQDNTNGNPNDALPYFTAQAAGAGLSYGLLESAALAGGVGYEIEGQQVFYNNMPNGIYENVLVTYLPTLSGLQEEDEMPCPAEFINALADEVKQSFMFQRQYPDNKIEGS